MKNTLRDLSVFVGVCLLLVAGAYSPGLVTDIKNGKVFLVNSAGDDKAVTIRHDDTDGEISTTSGDLNLIPNGGEVVVTGNLDLSGGVTTDGTVYIGDVAAAAADVAGFGQLWVKNTTPDELWFTDDAGTDFQLSTTGCSAKRNSAWHDESTVTNGNALASTTHASQTYQMWAGQNPAADADAWTSGFELASGEYTFYVLCLTTATSGILDMTLGGVTVFADEDFYSGSTVYNVTKSAPVTLVTGGWQPIVATVDGKNGSSSDYKILITKMWAKQASD